MAGNEYCLIHNESHSTDEPCEECWEETLPPQSKWHDGVDVVPVDQLKPDTVYTVYADDGTYLTGIQFVGSYTRRWPGLGVRSYLIFSVGSGKLRFAMDRGLVDEVVEGYEWI